MPIAQQCFATIKADSGRQLDEISKRIDRMMQQLMSESGQRERENVRALSDDSREISNEPTRNHRDLTASAALCTPDMTAFSMAKRQTKVRGRRVRHWWRSWKFRWTIGTLWVTVSTTTTDRRTPSEFHIGGIPSPQKAYRVTIEFLPAQSLVQLRGLTLSVANSQDQRGYSQICPFLSTFAVVSSNADVMRYARHNNVDGLQDLFEKRLAAPSDRTKKGETPLMVYLVLHQLSRLHHSHDSSLLHAQEQWKHANFSWMKALILWPWTRKFITSSSHVTATECRFPVKIRIQLVRRGKFRLL